MKKIADAGLLDEEVPEEHGDHVAAPGQHVEESKDHNESESYDEDIHTTDVQTKAFPTPKRSNVQFTDETDCSETSSNIQRNNINRYRLGLRSTSDQALNQAHTEADGDKEKHPSSQAEGPVSQTAVSQEATFKGYALPSPTNEFELHDYSVTANERDLAKTTVRTSDSTRERECVVNGDVAHTASEKKEIYKAFKNVTYEQDFSEEDSEFEMKSSGGRDQTRQQQQGYQERATTRRRDEKARYGTNRGPMQTDEPLPSNIKTPVTRNLHESELSRHLRNDERPPCIVWDCAGDFNYQYSSNETLDSKSNSTSLLAYSSDEDDYRHTLRANHGRYKTSNRDARRVRQPIVTKQLNEDKLWNPSSANPPLSPPSLSRQSARRPSSFRNLTGSSHLEERCDRARRRRLEIEIDTLQRFHRFQKLQRIQRIQPLREYVKTLSNVPAEAQSYIIRYPEADLPSFRFSKPHWSTPELLQRVIELINLCDEEQVSLDPNVQGTWHSKPQVSTSELLQQVIALSELTQQISNHKNLTRFSNKEQLSFEPDFSGILDSTWETTLSLIQTYLRERNMTESSSITGD